VANAMASHGGWLVASATPASSASAGQLAGWLASHAMACTLQWSKHYLQ